MKIIKLGILTALLGPSLAFCAEAPTAATTPPVDPMVEALPILQKSYAHFSALNYKPGDKLADVIARSHGEVALLPASAPLPIQPTILAGGVLYFRLASFALPSGKGWLDITSSLAQSGVRGVILDLRSNTTPEDYDGAAHFRDYFGPSTAAPAPRSDVTPDRLPVTQKFPYPRVVLVNGQTTGAAEALAGFLQADGAVVIGRPTAGQAADFGSAPLASGQRLRYVVNPPATGDPLVGFRFRDQSPAWGRPVVPDVTPSVDDHAEKAALVLIRDGHIADVIEESPARHRMSEAALLQNQDPEYDSYLTALEDHPVLLSLPVIHDAALITALDSLKAIRVSQLDPPPATTAPGPADGGASVQ